jgi:hypothetical protein
VLSAVVASVLSVVLSALVTAVRSGTVSALVSGAVSVLFGGVPGNDGSTGRTVFGLVVIIEAVSPVLGGADDKARRSG